MITRREFLLSSLAVAGYCAAGTAMFAAGSQIQAIGAQLYTVREQAERDLATVLQTIRKIGYEEIELYSGIYSRTATELRRMLTDHGLRTPSGHFDYDGLDAKLDYARALGLEYVICPMLPRSMWNSLDDYKRAADQFNVWGEKAKSMGMRFGFHNHNYEFRKLGDTTGFDTLMARTDPKLVCFELDCYWLVQAGRDLMQTLEQHGDRIQMLHLKDRKPGFPPSQELDDHAMHFAEVGEGAINWKQVLTEAKKDHVTHLFVEQDAADRPPLEALQISYNNLRKIL